jgi:adenosylcobinamide-GDP ribazoletransferase
MSSNEANPSEIGIAVGELKSAAIFLTRLSPRLLGVDPAKAPDFTTGSRVFPVVGALVGLAGGLVLLVAVGLGISPLVASVLAVATTAILTGGLHEDGLADFADSFGGTTTDEKLEIMSDSRVGTYGAFAIGFSLIARVAALSAVAAGGSLRAALVLIAAEAISRAALVRLWHELPAARAGLSSDVGPPDQNAMLVALAIAAVVAVVFCLPTIGLWATILAGALAAIATYALIRVVGHALGGRTGDALGACQQIALAAFLVGASAG